MMSSSVNLNSIFAIFVYLIISIQYSLCPAECEIPKKDIYSSDVTVFCDEECLSFCVPTSYWMKREEKYNCTFAIITPHIESLPLAEPNPNLNVEMLTCNLTTAFVLKSIENIGLKPYKRLILNGAQLTGSDALDGFENIIDLRLINVTMNDVLDGNLFAEFKQLTRLDLVNNSIDTFPENIFQNQTKLRHLNLAGNNLKALPTGVFDDLENLIELDLSRNGLGASDLKPLNNLPSLEVLNLNQNELDAVSSDLLENFYFLTSLSLAGNNLTSLPYAIFTNVPNLKKLDLSGNQLKYIDFFSDLENLDVLNLSNNQLDSDDSEEMSKYFPKVHTLQFIFDRSWNITELNWNYAEIIIDDDDLPKYSNETKSWLKENQWDCDCDSSTFRYIHKLSVHDVEGIKCTNNLTIAEQMVNCENRLKSITGFYIFLFLFIVGMLVIVGFVYLCDLYDKRFKNKKNVQ